MLYPAELPGVNFCYCIKILTISLYLPKLTNEPNSHLSTFSIKLRNYIVQIVDFVTYSSQERPFPFNPLPEEDND